MVLVEPDLFLRQLPFHTPQARAAPGVDEGLRGTAARAGLPTSYVASSADHPSDARLVEVLARHPVSRLEVYDVVDDGRGRNLQQVARLAGAELTVHETPAFLTTDAELREMAASTRRPRMQHLYERQRRRLGVLMDGGRWSFDTENRSRRPRGTAADGAGQRDAADAVRRRRGGRVLHEAVHRRL
jgi:deoxyribodipyrimidine photolyase-related protein